MRVLGFSIVAICVARAAAYPLPQQPAEWSSLQEKNPSMIFTPMKPDDLNQPPNVPAQNSNPSPKPKAVVQKAPSPNSSPKKPQVKKTPPEVVSKKAAVTKPNPPVKAKEPSKQSPPQALPQLDILEKITTLEPQPQPLIPPISGPFGARPIHPSPNPDDPFNLKPLDPWLASVTNPNPLSSSPGPFDLQPPSSLSSGTEPLTAQLPSLLDLPLAPKSS